MTTGFINLIKPEGLSSAKAVAAVKRKFNVPCGHMGTLDPMASGVLPVGIGKTSRLFPYLLEKTKVYKAEFTFGAETDTLDKTGAVTCVTEKIPSEEEIRESLGRFIGDVSQVPPKYSAKCVDGKRGYSLARAGVEFELKPKTVSIYSFDLIGRSGEKSFLFEIKCGGGTYIRSLCRDLGYAVGSLAYMSMLERTESGTFTKDTGVLYEEFIASDNPERYVIPAETAVSFPQIFLTDEQSRKLINGLYPKYGFEDGLYKIYATDGFWGVGEVTDGTLRMKSYVRK